MGTTLAKHGYTVEFGYFSGTCRGSERKPVQAERTITDATILGLGKYAGECDMSAAHLKSGAVNPVRIHTGDKFNPTTRRYEAQYIAFGDGTAAQQTRAIELAVAGAESDARGARAHAKGLQQMADELHGTPLVLIVDEPKPAPAPKATVDVKTATVTGTFGSKADRKAELDKINRRFEQQTHKLQAIYLNVPNVARTEEMTAVYYAPMYPHQWKAKHSAAALKVFPQAAEIVKAIEELVAAREAVKAAP